MTIPISHRRMSTDYHQRLHRLIERLPRPLRSAAEWLLRPGSRWLRIPLGVLLITGGLLGFLPILGFWMVPLGALLLCEDFPIVRKPTMWVIDGVEHMWDRLVRWRRRRDGGDGTHQGTGQRDER